MTDIKMSEVFEAPEINFGGLFAQSLDDDKKLYAAHEAVRQHDKLADENKKLRELVSNVIKTVMYGKDSEGCTRVSKIGDEEIMLLESYHYSLNRT